MRAVSGPIWDTWNAAGALVGPDKRAHGRITVESAYQLNKSVGAVGTYTKLPVRWFQRADNSQIETEIPYGKSIHAEWTLDSDAATATIVIKNKDMMFGVPAELGRPGWFTPTRGDSPESLTRWGYTNNTWHGVLTEGALIRTYEGYGGHDKTLAQAITDGNLVRTGTWLVDRVKIGTDGLLTMECRNMAALVVDQPVSDDLVPVTGTDGRQVYPLTYSRFFDNWVTTPKVEYGNVYGRTKWITGMARGPEEGYWLVGSDGGVFTFGLNYFYGSMGADTVFTPVMVGIASAPNGDGYWLVDASGAVFSFGNVAYLGGETGLAAPVVGIQAHPTGLGYYIVASDGGVFTHGSAVFQGSGVGMSTHPIVDIGVRPQGDGYWLVSSIGEIYTFGTGVPFYGGSPPIGVGTVVGMDVTPSGLGYIIVTSNGGVFCFGDAVPHGSAIGITLNDPITDVIIHPDNAGYWLVAEDGGIFTYGDIPFIGSLPGAGSTDFPTDGNYLDFIDIIKELLLWSGFWLYASVEGDGRPTVYGNLESTGAYSPTMIPQDTFDKKPVIDGINAIKEIVAYIFWVDEDGAPIFTSPNYFTRGNYLTRGGSHTTTIPNIDEAKQLTDYAIERNVDTLVSMLTVRAVNMDTGAIETTTYTPPGASNLRGRSEPVTFAPPIYLNATERLTMARLVSMHIWFAQRVGSVTCLANPLVQLDDQVRIWERQTSETYIHYVRGKTTDHDLEAGKYEMNLTTHWLGDEHAWAADLFT